MSPRARKRGNKRPNKRSSPKARGGRSDGKQITSTVGFWGDASSLPPARQHVRITEDPAAVARSLGPPPLPGYETIAEHYFAAVYDRAVTLAGALAAVGGLIKPEELQENLGD